MSDDPELAQIMDVVERHWRGAGVKPSARFIIDGYCSLGEEIERLSDELKAKDATIAALAGYLRDMKTLIDRQHDSAEMVDGGDLRYWSSLLGCAIDKAKA